MVIFLITIILFLIIATIFVMIKNKNEEDIREHIQILVDEESTYVRGRFKRKRHKDVLLFLEELGVIVFLGNGEYGFSKGKYKDMYNDLKKQYGN